MRAWSREFKSHEKILASGVDFVARQRIGLGREREIMPERGKAPRGLIGGFLPVFRGEIGNWGSDMVPQSHEHGTGLLDCGQLGEPIQLLQPPQKGEGLRRVMRKYVSNDGST